jgi:hypothetical protein
VRLHENPSDDGECCVSSNHVIVYSFFVSVLFISSFVASAHFITLALVIHHTDTHTHTHTHTHMCALTNAHTNTHRRASNAGRCVTSCASHINTLMLFTCKYYIVTAAVYSCAAAADGDLTLTCSSPAKNTVCKRKIIQTNENNMQRDTIQHITTFLLSTCFEYNTGGYQTLGAALLCVRHSRSLLPRRRRRRR